ncbi:MAG: hypothetical protein H0W70_15740 [Actinobacteria bacterium]|nr:hypothetical protein [Actinomycetota bacterium]
MTRTLRLLLVLVAVAGLAAACGGDKNVGDKSLLEGTDGAAADRLGATTTTAAAAPGPGDGPATTAAPTKATTKATAAASS